MTAAEPGAGSAAADLDRSPTSKSGLFRARLELSVDGIPVDLALAVRVGSGPAILFLHGFGGTKEDFAGAALQAVLDGRPLIAYDAPGCGETTCRDVSAISIPFLVATAHAALTALGVDRFHIVGHSMGGLTALMLADRDPARIASFVDIEGNLAPEDCFLSRRIIGHLHTDPSSFLTELTDQVWRSAEHSAALYASSLAHKVRAEAVRPIFKSMVGLSDSAELLHRFLQLPFPRMFMYGEQNRTLSYLPTLANHGVELAEIPQSGHWPMYSNPPHMWRLLTEFVTRVNAESVLQNLSEKPALPPPTDAGNTTLWA